MPLIYAALDLPRHPSWRFDATELPEHWEDWVAEYRVAFRQAGITEEWIRTGLDGPAHQEFLINMRVAEHNNPDGAPFAIVCNHVMVYGAYASAAARNGAPEQARRRRPAPSSAGAQTMSSEADPITRSGDPALRGGIGSANPAASPFPRQASTGPFLPEVWAQLDGIDLVEEFKQRVDTFVGGDYIRAQGVALSHFFSTPRPSAMPRGPGSCSCCFPACC